MKIKRLIQKVRLYVLRNILSKHHTSLELAAKSGGVARKYDIKLKEKVKVRIKAEEDLKELILKLKEENHSLLEYLRLKKQILKQKKLIKENPTSMEMLVRSPYFSSKSKERQKVLKLTDKVRKLHNELE